MNGYLSFSESYALLKKYGIPVVNSVIVYKEKELEKACKKLNFPLAMKVSSPDIVHKTEAEGVILNINSVADAKKEYKNLIKKIKKNYRKARIEGVILQNMAPGLELIAGLKQDKSFGSVLMFGLGGVFVEALKDVSFRILPITKKDIYEMINELKGSRILEGFRGKKYNKNALVNLLFNLSKLGIKEKNILELDLNPIFINEKNALVVDVRIRKGEKNL